MRSVHPAHARPLWTLPAAAVLALTGCGGVEEPKASPLVASTSPAPTAGTPVGGMPVGGTPVGTENIPSTPAQAAQAISQGVPIVPFQVPIEGPIENEEGTEKPLVATFPEKSPPAARPSIDNLPSDDELLGKPLVIDGEVVPFDEIKKQVCLGPIGAAEIHYARVQIFIDEERQRLAESGAGKERMDLLPGELENYLKAVEDDLTREYPEGEMNLEDLFNGLSANDPTKKLYSQMLFGKLFLPHDPSLYPPLTLEAILKQPGGQSVIEHYKTTYEESLGQPNTVKDIAESQFDAAILQQVLTHLMEVASIVVEPEPDVLYRVNGVDIKVDDIWNRIREHVSPMDVLAAKQWMVNTRLLKKAIVAAGSWLDDEEAYAAYHAHSDPFKDSIFSLESVALMVKQFPSLERYQEHRRITDSFQRMRNPSAEELQAFADRRTKKIIGQVSVDVDIILCSAYDFRANRWKKNGWADAENRMKDVLRLLVEEQRPWDELVERYSDFYEPPTPMSKRGEVDPNKQAKGRFRNVQRNNLLRELGETDYNMFLNGTSVTDFIFFEQEVLSLGQPMRGPLGWYLPRLLRRTKPPQRIPMDEQTMRELVMDDYLTVELNEYAQELIEKSEVYGLDYP